MRFNSLLLKEHEWYRNIEVFECEVTSFKSPSNVVDNSISFFTKWNESVKVKNCILIIPQNAVISPSISKNNCIIYSKNPRLDYAIISSYILTKFNDFRKYKEVNFSILGEDVKIGENTIIEPMVFIDHDVVIGDGCKIMSGARLCKNVVIGNNTVIRKNAVIGEQGFGIEKDSAGKTYRIPHVGGVIIGDNVDIGALCTVDSGTIDPTLIDDFVKTDAHVHIAHNCHIGEKTLITACVEISGSVDIGKNSIIGPNASIMNKIKLGEDTIIGLGAVVTKSFSSGKTLFGNPADTIEKITREKAELKVILSQLK